jgi:hypothetical protein
MIKWIVIAFLGLIILGYLGVDIKQSVQSPVTQSNIGYVKDVVVYVWTKYLETPAKYLWNEIFIKLIWTTAIDNLTKMKNGEPTNVQTSAPILPTAPAH